MMYRNFDTNELFTEEEAKTLYEQFKDEMPYESYEDYMEDMLSKGRRKEGGLVELVCIASIDVNGVQTEIYWDHTTSEIICDGDVLETAKTLEEAKDTVKLMYSGSYWNLQWID